MQSCNSAFVAHFIAPWINRRYWPSR